MSSLIQDFLSGAQRVTARIYYFIPKEKGSEPFVMPSKIIGERAKVMPHTPVLQEYTQQFDDKPDFEDERLVKVFQKLVVANNGIVRIQDRSQRLTILQEETSETIIPVLIPRKVEQINPGLQDEVLAFKTLIPFPRVRQFLQFWQEKLEGPLHQVQLISSPIPDTDWRNVPMERTLN